MAPVPYKGQLTTWKDERGFGFIKPEGDGKEIFLHVSALPRASRRPKVGDTILYEKVTAQDGRVLAAKASIEGVTSAPRQITRPIPTAHLQPTRSKLKQKGWLQSLIGLVGLVIVAASTIPAAYKSFWTQVDANSPVSPNTQSETTTPPTPLKAVINPNCVVKGNISISTGSKLYHVPGMEDYEGTEIHLDEGERWFCTEAEAIAAGWRRAPR